MAKSTKSRSKKRSRDVPAHSKGLLRLVRLNYLGLVVGFIVYFISLTPSLMPRPPILMGVVAGIGFATGYCIGVFISYAIRRKRLISEPSKENKHRSWFILAALTPPFILLTSYLARYWQNEQRELLERPPISDLDVLAAISMALMVFIVLVLIRWGLAWVFAWVKTRVDKIGFLSPRAVTISACIVAAFLVISVLSGLLQRTAVVALDSIYSADNNFVDLSFPQPESELRSGSPSSKFAWMDLGREGRRFVSSGPDAEDISEFTGKPAVSPIRVYTGLNNASSIQDRVNLALEELERTGAFDRKILMVAIPTGSGWVDAETVAAFEYMHGGDTAIVAAQYSYLPGALAFFLDREDSIDMAEELFHAVENKIQSLQRNKRPKLMVYGLGLGSFAGQSDFTGEKDFDSRLDAGLFVGTPGFTEPWRYITSKREAGTLQIEPVYNDEKVIKFVDDSEDVIDSINPKYKLVYLQYATDPIVWFDGHMLYRKPDWMSEEPGRGVSPHFVWLPIVTGAQISIDQVFALTFSDTNGHEYSQDAVAALAVVTNPNNWSADRSRALEEIISSKEND